MANQINIDIGAVANDGTGDPLRTAFNYVNLNFANVWATGLPNSNVQFNNNRILTVNTNANLVLAPNGIGVVQSNVSILPNTDRVHNLGSATRKWNNLYAYYLNIDNFDLNGDLTVGGNLTVEGNTIQIGNIVTDTKTIQLSNTAVTANAANGSGITVGANDNIATMLYSSTSNTWTMNIGISAVGNITAPYFIGNGSLLTGIGGSYSNANVAAYLPVYNGNISAAYISVANNVNVNNDVFAKRGSFTGDPVTGDASLYVGSPSFTNLGTDVMAQFTGNVPAYAQINLQNYGNSNTSSGDYIITADNGNDTTHFLNLGLTGSNWNGTQPNSLGNRLGPNDGYLYVQDGDMVIGTSNGNIETWKFDQSGNLTVPGDVIPAGNNTQSLGSATRQWADLWVSNATIYMNSVPITLAAGNILTVGGNAVLQNNSNTSITTTGNISAANLAVTGSGLTWANASIIQTSSEDFSITGDGQVTVRSLDGTYQWTFDNAGNLTAPGNIGTSANVSANYFIGDGSQLTNLPSGSGLPIANGSSNFNIATSGGNATIDVAGLETWTFDTDGNVTIPGSIVGTATINIDNRATGNSADIQLYSADDILLQARDRSAGSGAEGGDISIFAGDSAEDGDTSGGDISIFAGDGGAANVDFGGSGGFITIQSGRGGAASTGVGGESAQDGGALTLRAGAAGSNMGNIARGAAGGEVIVRGGDSTGNLDVGGSITLQPGSGGDNASAGAVYINIPFSTQGPGGEWLFSGTGNTLTTPADAVISSADGNLRIRSSLNTVLNADPYNWTFNNDGNLVTAPISIPTEGPTGEAQRLRGTRRLIGGFEAAYPYSQILDNNSGSTIAWEATDDNTVSARITFNITYTNSSFSFQAREMLTVDVVQDLAEQQAYFSVSGRMGTNGYAPGVVSASIVGNKIQINIVPDGIYYYGLAVYDAVEFRNPLD